MDGYGSGTNIKGYVLVNGTPNPGGLVKAGGPQHHSFNSSTNLNAGQTIDFAVDMNGGHAFDATGLHALVAWQ